MSSDKIKIGILGATGVVGQNYIKLLVGHPWFEIVDVAASPQSAGKPYSEAVTGRWRMPIEILCWFSQRPRRKSLEDLFYLPG